MKVFCRMDESKPRTVVIECTSALVYEDMESIRCLDGEEYFPLVLEYFDDSSIKSKTLNNILDMELM